MADSAVTLPADAVDVSHGLPSDAVDVPSAHNSVSTPTEFFQTLRDHLWPSAVGVAKQTAAAYQDGGPQGGTVSQRDTRIPADAPMYGFRKTLLDLEDSVKSIYDKVTNPARTVANDPVGVAADFGKLVSSIRIAKDMAEGKPSPQIQGDTAMDAVGKAVESPTGQGIAAGVREATNLPIAKSIKVGLRKYRQAQTEQAMNELPTIDNPIAATPPIPEQTPATPAQNDAAVRLGAKSYAEADDATKKIADAIAARARATPAVQTIPFEPVREAAGAAKATKAQAAVADKIGSALVKSGVTDDLLEQISKSKEAEDAFKAKVGAIHAEDYVPSDKTWAAIRDFVKAKEAEAPKTVPITDAPAYLKNNPKALKIAEQLQQMNIGDSMKGGK